MALYVDSADRAAVGPLLATGLFAGVATNPTLLARAGLRQADLPALVAWAVAEGARTVFAQTLGTAAGDVAAAGRELAALGDRVVVKVPATREGLTAARVLADEAVPVLVTAAYHPAQALAAAAAGARWIAPYVGRMTDRGRDGVGTAATMAGVLAGTGVRVLAASVRTVDDVVALAAAGVGDLALNPGLAAALLADELTDAAAAEFEAVARRGPAGS